MTNNIKKKNSIWSPKLKSTVQIQNCEYVHALKYHQNTSLQHLDLLLLSSDHPGSHPHQFSSSPDADDLPLIRTFAALCTWTAPSDLAFPPRTNCLSLGVLQLWSEHCHCDPGAPRECDQTYQMKSLDKVQICHLHKMKHGYASYNNSTFTHNKKVWICHS